MPRLDFWYEFASTYSYLSAMRVGEMAREAGVDMVWRPFLLGPIFEAQGWDTSPFNIYAEKGAYMWRDMERLCAARGLVFHRPDPFPQNGLYAARLALIGAEEGWADNFSRAVFTAEFAQGKDISAPPTLVEALSLCGVDTSEMLARIGEQALKDRLRDQTSEAMELGIFGAPTFICPDGEMFWGDDRLEQALRWAVSRRG